MFIEAKDVQEILQKGLPESQITVQDPLNDGTHLQATIISPCFEGMNRVARHRMVYEALGDVFEDRLHALQLITKTPEEA